MAPMSDLASLGDLTALMREAIAAQEVVDYQRLAVLARAIVAHCETSNDVNGQAWGHYFAAAASFQRNDGTTAARTYRRARELFESCGNREGVARSMLGAAAVALDIELDVATARHLFDGALPIVRKLGDRRRLAIALGNLAEVYRLEGHVTRAIESAQESLAIFRQIEDPASVGWQLTNLAHFYLLRRDYDAARASLDEAYPQLVQDPIPREIALFFDVAFIFAGAREEWETAARLLGWTNHYRDVQHAPRLQGMLPWFSRPVERLSEHIESDRLHELFVESESLTQEQARALSAAIAAAP